MNATTTTYDTREQWLIAAVTLLTPLFTAVNLTVPPIHVTCGWPAVGGTRLKKRRIGECWKTEASEDGVNHIFISPVLDQPVTIHVDDDGEESGGGNGILEVLVHELCHAVDDGENGHKAPFFNIAKAVGLTGKATSTYASPELLVKLVDIEEELGVYPHGRINIQMIEKKQTTRMLKVECPEDGYTVRTTRKWLDVGLPTCPCGETMMEETA